MANSKFSNEPVLDFFPRPWSFAQKRETGFYRRIDLKTTYGDATPHFAPAMLLNKLIEDSFQGDAVKRIAGMKDGCQHKISSPEIFHFVGQ